MNIQKELQAIKEEKCEECGGYGYVSVMERVYPNEPHMAPTGEERCPKCNSRNYEDDFDNRDDQE